MVSWQGGGPCRPGTGGAGFFIRRGIESSQGSQKIRFKFPVGVYESNLISKEPNLRKDCSETEVHPASRLHQLHYNRQTRSNP